MEELVIVKISTVEFVLKFGGIHVIALKSIFFFGIKSNKIRFYIKIISFTKMSVYKIGSRTKD